MKFADIIREAGGSCKNHPKASQILVTLYDEDDCVDTSVSVHFYEPLFARNRREQSRFLQRVKALEKKTVDEMCVKVTPDYVVLFYKSPKPEFFRRN